MNQFWWRNMLSSVRYLLASILALLFLLPVSWMILTSLKPEGSNGWSLQELTLENYRHVLEQAPIFSWLGNSLIVASCTTFLILLFDSLAAFALSRISFPGRKWLFVLFLSGMMIPAEATLIPLYLQMRDFGLLNTLSAIILPAVAAPIGIFILKQFFDGLPHELVEAAKVDGAGFFRIWFQIFLPLSKPALSAVGIFTFIMSWNDFLWPLVAISDPDKMTITLGLPNFQSAYLQQYALPMAANTLASLPVLIVFILFQKQIIKGISYTGGKES